MTKRILAAGFLFLFPILAEATTAGTITSPVFAYSFGSAPLKDTLDFSGQK